MTSSTRQFHFPPNSRRLYPMTPKAHRLTALFQKLAHTPSRKRRRALCIALRNEAARLFAPGPTPRTVAVRISTTNPKRNP